MIGKILVANRQGVAVRIFRACTEMDIKPAAVYAASDRHAARGKNGDDVNPERTLTVIA